MGILSVLKNNLNRATSQKSYIIVSLVMTIISILLAVYFTSKFEMKGNIAVVTASEQFNLQSKHLNVKVLREIPPKSDLVMNRYDAIIIDKGNGNFEIDSIKNSDFENKLSQAIKNHDTSSFITGKERGVGSNILGYLVMFVMLQGMLYMLFLSEDKEFKVLKRVVTSPISVGSYLLGHSIFNFMLVYLPTFMVLIISKELLRINIGFTYFQYSYLLGIIVLLSTAFALFMATIIDKMDNSMTMASTIIVLTSILSGSFYSFGNNNSILKSIIGVIPQKSYLTLIQGIEQGKSVLVYIPQISYLLGLALLLFILGAVISKRKFIEGQY